MVLELIFSISTFSPLGISPESSRFWIPLFAHLFASFCESSNAAVPKLQAAISLKKTRTSFGEAKPDFRLADSTRAKRANVNESGTSPLARIYLTEMRKPNLITIL
jgi:hypothetical protein